MTADDSDRVLEFANLVILFMQRLNTLEDMVVAIDVRLEAIEKVMD